VVGVHVLQDSGSRVRKWVGVRLGVVRGGDPPHNPKTAYVVNIDHVHAKEGKSSKSTQYLLLG